MSAGETAKPESSARARAMAWGIHAFTASGVVWGLLALQAVEARDWAATMRWLFVALVVDAVDGPLARACKVKEVLPAFDGNILDLVVDYVTYVFVPAVMLYRADLLPPEMRTFASAAVLLSSLYHYGNVDIKTRDGYFEGFPAFWNIVVFYLYRFNLGQGIAAGIVLGLCLLTLLPVKCVHPFRVKRFRRATAAVTVAWAVLAGAALLRVATNVPEPWMLWANLAPVVYLVAISLRRTINGPDPVGAEVGGKAT